MVFRVPIMRVLVIIRLVLWWEASQRGRQRRQDVQGHDRNAGLVETLRPTSHVIQGRREDWPHHDLIEKRGDARAGGSGIKSVNNGRAFVVGRNALGYDAGIVVKKGGGVLAEMTGGSKEVAVLVPKTNTVVFVIETEASDIGDESGVVDTEEDDIDEMSGGMVGFENVDFIVVHIWCLARDGRGSPQGLGEDGGLGAHSATSENDGLVGIREEGEPRRYN